MALTIPDIPVDDTAWLNLNTISGIAVGTALTVTNKSGGNLMLQLSIGQPTDGSKDGMLLAAFCDISSTIYVNVGETGALWAKSSSDLCTVSLQDNT